MQTPEWTSKWTRALTCPSWTTAPPRPSTTTRSPGWSAPT
ncbi:hypothetical protein CRUP_011048 [Coryphaenoides rupestris]|nr:hypothetical protein CRUP_011048 [Coryphaenoides rupestris]